MRTAILLTISNIFMTFAWYGHLKFEKTALWIVILASWGIAFFEYAPIALDMKPATPARSLK